MRVRRRTWPLALAIMALGGCGGEQEPSPALGERYDVVIAVCNERLANPTDFCTRINSSEGDQVYANVIFGRAGGRAVTVRTEVIEGGHKIDQPPPDRVPPNRSWLHSVELKRGITCDAPVCSTRISALVDGQEVAAENFRFSAP